MIRPTPFLAIPTNRRRKFELDAACNGSIDGIAVVLSAQVPRDLLRVVDYGIAIGQTAT